MTTTLDAQKVKDAILKWPGRYSTADGTIFQGMPVSQVASQLRDCGWRNVPRLDSGYLEDMGLEIVEARYVGGARPKKFCQVVVARRVPFDACRTIGAERDLIEAEYVLLDRTASST